MNRHGSKEQVSLACASMAMERKQNSIVPLRSETDRSRIRLVCLPYAGGNVAAFGDWSTLLPRQLAFYAIELPGHGRRFSEPLQTDINALAEEVANALREFSDKPIALFGHSMGAILAFEVARRVSHDIHADLVHLFVSGHPGPTFPDRTPDLHHLPEAEFRERVVALNGLPTEVIGNSELLDILFPILRADFVAAETYKYEPGPKLRCPISAYGGLQDEKVTREGLAAWQFETAAAFNKRSFRGDHFFIKTNAPAVVRDLARAILIDSKWNC